MKGFLRNIQAAAKSLAQTVGKAAAQAATGALQQILSLIDQIELTMKAMLKMGKRVLATIRKTADKNRVVRILKTVIRRYIQMFRQIWSWICDFHDQLDLLGNTMAVIRKMRQVLQLAFSWIDDVTQVVSALKRTRTLLKKTIKAMRIEVKDAIKLAREVKKMPVPEKT